MGKWFVAKNRKRGKQAETRQIKLIRNTLEKQQQLTDLFKLSLMWLKNIYALMILKHENATIIIKKKNCKKQKINKHQENLTICNENYYFGLLKQLFCVSH